MDHTRNDRTTLLRIGLLGNAAFSTLCSIGLLTQAPGIAAALAIPFWVAPALGVGLLLFAAALVVQARRRPMRLLEALVTSVADLGWVVGSGVFLALRFDALSPVGIELVIGVALVVGLAATVQLAGIRRIAVEPDARRGTRNTFSVTRVVEAPRDSLWGVVAELDAVRNYSDDLTESFIRDAMPPGRGAVRECADRSGKRWSERCVAWEPGHSLEMEFHADEPGFPFPMRRMVGGWILEPKAKGTTEITVWWSFTTKPVWAGTVLTALLGHQLQRSFPTVLERMAKEARRRSGPEANPHLAA